MLRYCISMKRLYLLIISLLLVVPAIQAVDEYYSIELTSDKNSIQVGDPVFFNGKVYKNNNLLDDQVNAIFYIRNGDYINQIYLSIFDGTFSFSPKFRDLPSGTYSISVSLFDLGGELIEEFDDIRQLFVDNKLILDLQVDNDQLVPGDKLQILGVVQRNLDKANVQTGVITIRVDGEEYVSEVSNGNLDFEIQLANNINSNYHTVYINAEDSHGNYGETSLDFFVIPQQESLEIITEQKTHLPGEMINIYAKVYDQASNEVSDDVTFEILNPRGKEIHKETVLSTTSINYLLDEYATPGVWTIKAESSLGLKKEKVIDVLVVEKLLIEVVGQTLEVKNVGNVKYNEMLKIHAFNEEHEDWVYVRTKLDSGEIMSVELFRDLKNMIYTIEVLDYSFEVTVRDERGFGERTGDFFGGITGQLIRSPGSKEGNGSTYFFGLIFLSLLVLVFLFKRPGFNERKKKLGKVPKFKTKKNGNEIFKKSHEKEEIENFKTRILKDIDESNVREEKKEEKPFNVQPFLPIPNEKNSEEKPKRVNFDRPLKRDKW